MKLNPKVFKLAAEVVFNNGCCYAIAQAIGGGDHIPKPRIKRGDFQDHVGFFGECFKPRTIAPAWWMGYYEEDGVWIPERDPIVVQNSRVIALLLCAEMVKDQNEQKKR